MSRQCAEVLDRFQSLASASHSGRERHRISHSLDLLDRVIRQLGIPVTTAWTHDLIASDDLLFCGRPGTIGTRAGNFTVQNAETLLVFGSRLNIRQVSYNWSTFARHAFKIQVDVDPAELHKPTVRPDFAIQCDPRVFLEELDRQIEPRRYDLPSSTWLAWCRERVGASYPVVLPRHRHWTGRITHITFWKSYSSVSAMMTWWWSATAPPR